MLAIVREYLCNIDVVNLYKNPGPVHEVLPSDVAPEFRVIQRLLPLSVATSSCCILIGLLSRKETMSRSCDDRI